jgi:hypothetical protein
LRPHLDEKRAGEDARTTLKHTREWHQEAEEDHNSSAPSRTQGKQGWRGSACDDDIGPYGARCRAFTADLPRVYWPTKFRPDVLEKYNGTIDPKEFLQIYTTVSDPGPRGCVHNVSLIYLIYLLFILYE